MAFLVFCFVSFLVGFDRFWKVELFINKMKVSAITINVHMMGLICGIKAILL